jgi:hypothetical protein
MRNFTDTELAKLMLERQQRGDRRWWLYFKINKWRLILLFSLIVFLLYLGTLEKAWGFCGFLLGLVTGAFSRDGTWIRYQRKLWPFYAKVIDWEKVENIANENKIPG